MNNMRNAKFVNKRPVYARRRLTTLQYAGLRV